MVASFTGAGVNGMNGSLFRETVYSSPATGFDRRFLGAAIEGSRVRPYTAKQNLNQDETSRVTVPTVRLGYPMTRGFSLGFSYCR
jgi:hypothetical protein